MRALEARLSTASKTEAIETAIADYVRQDTARGLIEEPAARLRWVELTRDDWILVGSLAANLRSRGEKLPLIDIDVAAISSGTELATQDTDFDRISAVEPRLKLTQPGRIEDP